MLGLGLASGAWGQTRPSPEPAPGRTDAQRSAWSPDSGAVESSKLVGTRVQLAESAAQGIEQQEWMTPIEEALQKGIAAAFQAGGAVGHAIKNVLHGTWLGHPLHPVLTDIPLGAWTTALVFDTLDSGSRGWPWQDAARRRARHAILVGVFGAGGAPPAGLSGWQETDGKARRTGLAHAA